jgi:Flp pilus assembly protein TadG
MNAPLRSPSRSGQVLPLFALFLVALLAVAALAIDVSGALSARRFYRSAADAASLAGAQDLQQGTTRTITATERTNARTHALQQLVSLLGGSSASCNPAADVVNCPMGPYQVTVKTPSPTCVNCDPARSVQVTVRNPSYGLSFARIVGMNSWNVASTSVAGLTFGKSYTIITLRPPKALGSTFDVKDIRVDGGSIVNVVRGDVGSNSNMEYSGSGSQLTLDPAYNMYYFDPFNAPLWGGTNPTGTKIDTLIDDPGYRYPDMTGAPTFTDARTSQYAAAGSPVDRGDDAACAAEIAKVPASYGLAAVPVTSVYCFSPGIYNSPSGPNRARVTLGTGEIGLLKPGSYYFKSGLDIGGQIIGGYEPGATGVALMFDECSTTQCDFSGNNAVRIALNAGNRFPPGAAGTAATAARDWTGQLVQTSGPSSPTPPLPITLLVNRDPACFVPTSAPFIEPAGCDANHNKTIFMAGGGSLALEGVQYLPTDNAQISGGSAGTGHVGQLISWTLFYSGGTHINQEGPAQEGNGILRLDAACTAPTTPCNP